MTKITYDIVQHDGGWAYKAEGVFSEPFPTHDAALTAARRVAREQQTPGRTAGISWEDDKGRWHQEIADGEDRPIVEVHG